MTKRQIIPQLKDCPFCGGKAEFRQMNYLGTDSDPYYIICTKCNMQTATTFESRSKQAKDWNRRINE